MHKKLKNVEKYKPCFCIFVGCCVFFVMASIIHKSSVEGFGIAYVEAAQYGIPSLERDSSVQGNDAVILLFDTYKDGNNAFFFESNPVGVKKDALISEGGDDIDMTWDIKWEVETYIGNGFYQCEFKIPLKSLKFPDGSKDWRFQVFRADISKGEFYLWNKAKSFSS